MTNGSYFEFDASDFFSQLTGSEESVKVNSMTALDDAAQDLLRISREAAPLDEGALRRSGKVSKFLDPNALVAEVSFSAVKGNYNYAYRMHEDEYQLGPSSVGGTDGYNVGNKFLQRPLEGESERYIRQISEAISRGLLR